MDDRVGDIVDDRVGDRVDDIVDDRVGDIVGDKLTVKHAIQHNLYPIRIQSLIFTFELLVEHFYWTILHI